MRTRSVRTLWLVPVLVTCLAATGSPDLGPDLRQQARDGEIEAVRDLLAPAPPDLDEADPAGWTALMYAVQAGHHKIVQMLLEAGASLDQKNPSGETALHLAATQGPTESARALLRAGADLDVRDSEGHTPLYRAIDGRQADIIEMLQAAALAKGGSPLAGRVGVARADTAAPNHRVHARALLGVGPGPGDRGRGRSHGAGATRRLGGRRLGLPRAGDVS